METFYVIDWLEREIRKKKCPVQKYPNFSYCGDDGGFAIFDCEDGTSLLKIGVYAFRTEIEAREKIDALMNKKINELREELARFESESKKEIFVVDCD